MVLLTTLLCGCVTLEPAVFTLTYTAGEGGTVEGETAQTVKQGGDATPVTAVADEGYEFVAWSDEVTTATRQDTAVSKNLTVTARFRKSEFTVTYLCAEGGYLEGQTTQTVAYGKSTTAVFVVAYDGYKFVKWSDDVTAKIRQDDSVQADITVTAIFEPAPYRVIRYVVEEGGELVSGQSEYVVPEGSSIPDEYVSVRAKDGYEFLGWSDGDTMEWRRDSAGEEDKTFVALFKRIDIYRLMDWYADVDSGIPTVEINQSTYTNLSFPVPTREHFTFNGWYLGDTMVADVNGRSLFTEDMLDYGGRNIFAKWTADETFTFKLLLVYPTRIDAVLPHKDPKVTKKVHVDFTMDEQMEQFCHLVTLRAKKHLDKLTDGLVNFQVDEYYMTEPVTTKDFSTTVGDTHISNLYVQNFAEVQDLLPQYDSALILYDATTNATNNASGMADPRYGSVMLYSFLETMFFNHVTLDQVIELMQNNEDFPLPGNFYLIDGYLMETITHELAHTIELRMNLASYHIWAFALRIHHKTGAFESNRYYYLCETIVDGQKVGIPYEFWKGDIAKCAYHVTETSRWGSLGYVIADRTGTYSEPAGSGNTFFEVIYGEYVTVTAVPFRGMRFVQWSDGVTTAERTDLITGDFTVTAIFEEI